MNNKRDLDRARRALARLKPEDRRALFLEFGECSCAAIAKSVVEQPAVAVGAVVGGILGATLAPSSSQPAFSSAPRSCPNCGGAIRSSTDHLNLMSLGTDYTCPPRRSPPWLLSR